MTLKRCPLCDVEQYRMTPTEAFVLGLGVRKALDSRPITDQVCEVHRSATAAAMARCIMMAADLGGWAVQGGTASAFTAFGTPLVQGPYGLTCGSGLPEWGVWNGSSGQWYMEHALFPWRGSREDAVRKAQSLTSHGNPYEARLLPGPGISR